MRPVLIIIGRIARSGDRVIAVRAGWTSELSPTERYSECGRSGPDIGRQIPVCLINARIHDTDYIGR